MGLSGDDRSLSAPVFQRSTPHEQFCHLNELANGLPNHPHVRADAELQSPRKSKDKACCPTERVPVPLDRDIVSRSPAPRLPGAIPQGPHR